MSPWYNSNAIAPDTNLLTWPTRLAASRIVVSCSLTGEPTSKARPRFSVTKSGRVATYNPPGPEAAQLALGWEMKLARRIPEPDTTHEFGIRAMFYSGTLQRRDVDNMLKLVLDAATGVIWGDDKQASEVHARIARDHGEPRTEVIIYITGLITARTIICSRCGKKAKTYRSWGIRRFCGRTCRDAALRAGETVPCGFCGSELYRSQHRLNTRLGAFCNNTCLSRSQSRETRCAQCRHAFRIAKTRRAAKLEFCNRGCGAAYYRAHPPKVAVGRCQTCGGATSRHTYTRCRACQLEADTEPRSNYWTRTP